MIFTYGLQNMTFSNNIWDSFITYLIIYSTLLYLFILYTSFWLQKSKPTLKHINETLSRLSVSEYGSSRSSLNLTRQEKNCKFLIYPNDISARQRNRFIIIYGSQMIYNELMTSLKNVYCLFCSIGNDSSISSALDFSGFVIDILISKATIYDL